ncbi:phosphatase PAP2 family protein [uncultured Draconibacterium sp.]|uniref:phosphatase PAP2 family protein n=1 Tax=uncultured Draconibacterium sp. TaxID=1573823 RepID=UPI0032608C96
MEFFKQILELDKELFLFLNGFFNDFWDTMMLLITRKETWIPFFLCILFFIVKNYRTKAILIILALALVVLASDQLSVLLKNTIQRLRPVYEPTIEHLVHNVLRKGGRFGFVSSHAANSVAIMVFTSRIFKSRSFYLLMLGWVLMFCYSRIYSGVHYPLDLLGGALLGWVVGFSVYKLLMFIENHFFFARSPKIEKTALPVKDAGTLLLVFVVLLTTAFIVSYLLHHYNYL